MTDNNDTINLSQLALGDIMADNECPGYNLDPGEDCGGPTMTGSDLCGDCHMARVDAESPRIPR